MAGEDPSSWERLCPGEISLSLATSTGQGWFGETTVNRGRIFRPGIMGGGLQSSKPWKSSKPWRSTNSDHVHCVLWYAKVKINSNFSFNASKGVSSGTHKISPRFSTRKAHFDFSALTRLLNRCKINKSRIWYLRKQAPWKYSTTVETHGGSWIW